MAIATRLIQSTVQDGGKTRASTDFEVLGNRELRVAKFLRLGLRNRTTSELLAHVQAALP